MTSERKSITPRQTAILEFIEAESAAKGYPPSVREIGEAVGLSSSSTVHSHLRTLEKKGYLRRDPSKPRALVIIPDQNVAAAIPPNIATSFDGDIISVPLLGRVAAGAPILAAENIEESMPMPASMVGGGTLFMLEVQGDSMIDAGILNGDYVVVRQQANAENGEIVVAMIDEEATVKRFFREKDHISLVAENPAYAPIKSRDVTLLGKVVSVFRSVR